MRLSSLFTATALVAFAALPALAQSGPEEKIKAELKKQIPEAPIESVRKVPYGNLYEVVANGEIFYTDEKGSYLVLGNIVDLKSKENVTEARLRQVNAIRFDQLDLKNAIKIVRGNGTRKLAMFADPNCGYCKRFERDLLGITDITVYVFLYPILSPDSTVKSRAVWCSADRGKAWIDLMTREVAPGGAADKCEAPLEQNLAFGQAKRIQGTPTLIFENGDRVPGAMSAADVEKKLAARTGPTASAR
jgi:thiol:disulfide interchange protein DsbC